MQISPIGLAVSELDTPALLIDLELLQHNIDRMAGHLRDRGVAWRPHAKAFKCPAIAHLLRRAGAIGVTVAKVSEAEVMADGGIDDILIAHLVVGPSKVARLAALQRQADVKVTVDHPDHVGPLGRAATAAGVTIGVLVDVDLGMKRTGVATAEAALELARHVSATPGLRFDGLMGYEGHTLMIADPAEKRAAVAAAIAKLLHARDVVEAAGLECRIISAGGSGSYQYTADIPGITEIQAGGGIFACQYYTKVCQVTGHRPALTRSGHRRQPARTRSRHPRHRPEVDQPTPNSSHPPGLSRLPGHRPLRRARHHRGRSAKLICKLEKKCMSFPVIAILLSYSTTVCSAFVRDTSRPPGTSWAAAGCNRAWGFRRYLLTYNHFDSDSKRRQQGSRLRVHG